MVDEALNSVAENIRILIDVELETQHWLDGHPEALAECPVCRSRPRALAPRGSWPAAP